MFRYATLGATKAVNLRTVVEISMDSAGQIAIVPLNGGRDIVILAPNQKDKLAFLQTALAQWERCIATR